MGSLVLILGGARSGKSTMAEKLALAAGGQVTYVATAEPRDDEMRWRIEHHRAARPAGWRTVEEPLDLVTAVERAAAESDVVLVDCLTLWLSNHLCLCDAPESSEEWAAAERALADNLERWTTSLVETARCHEVTLLLVSNEVGLGLVPANALGRIYRDLLGLVNRRLAAEADRVLLMVAGLPLDVKRMAELG
ncbi:MAG TPA: bifunctional adenosylcobinamide kinase/adenosylcobinamide-phosphate guanylyltransferase [Chloroflexota bacterium]|nr:bifunctional adenosylcobinamide kinase/adenosylcobinamide-phosphate guanylyltransferase [Chloroflexota bacterium]